MSYIHNNINASSPKREKMAENEKQMSEGENQPSLIKPFIPEMKPIEIMKKNKM